MASNQTTLPNVSENEETLLSVPRPVGWRAVRCLSMRQCATWSS